MFLVKFRCLRSVRSRGFSALRPGQRPDPENEGCALSPPDGLMHGTAAENMIQQQQPVNI